MMPPSENLSGGGAAVVNDNNNNNYCNHISSHTVTGSGSGCGISVNGNGCGISVKGRGFVNNGDENTLLAQTQSALRYSSNLSVVWTPMEDATLKELLAKYAPKSFIDCYDSKRFVDCYARIAKELNKSIRDIALRYKWMRDMENGKQRKDDHNPRKSKERKVKVTDSAPRSQVPNRTSCPPPPFAESYRPMDGNDGIPDEAIFGPMRMLTHQSAQVMSQVCENINTLKLQDNINLLSQVHDIAISVLNELNRCDMDVTENMYPMPPLPSKINEELVDKVLLQAPLFAKQS